MRLPYAIAIPSGVDGTLAVVALRYSVRFSFACVAISFTVLAILNTSTQQHDTMNTTEHDATTTRRECEENNSMTIMER